MSVKLDARATVDLFERARIRGAPRNVRLRLVAARRFVLGGAPAIGLRGESTTSCSARRDCASAAAISRSSPGFPGRPAPASEQAECIGLEDHRDHPVSQRGAGTRIGDAPHAGIRSRSHRGSACSSQHVYGVRFTARELWGPQTSTRDTLQIDLFDDYLDLAREPGE